MFYNDLKDAQKIEFKVKDFLSKLGFIVDLNASTDYNVLKAYDGILKYKGISTKIEIKNDKMGYTGNFVLEFECSHKLSGISTTEADLIIYTINDKLFIFKTDTLKQAIKDNLYKRIVNGGDYNAAKLYLFKQTDIFPLAIKEYDFKITN